VLMFLVVPWASCFSNQPVMVESVEDEFVNV